MKISELRAERHERVVEERNAAARKDASSAPERRRTSDKPEISQPPRSGAGTHTEAAIKRRRLEEAKAVETPRVSREVTRPSQAAARYREAQRAADEAKK